MGILVRLDTHVVLSKCCKHRQIRQRINFLLISREKFPVGVTYAGRKKKKVVFCTKTEIIQQTEEFNLKQRCLLKPLTKIRYMLCQKKVINFYQYMSSLSHVIE